MLVVVTLSAPQRWGAAPPPRSRKASNAPPLRCHSATDVPCSVRDVAAPLTGAGAPSFANCSSRVCWPASVSIFSVRSSCQEIFRRVGIRMMPPTPYASQRPSIDGSHASATFRPSPLSGTLVVSPFAGVRMRHCQSSVTTDTHVPVRSTGAPGRPGGGGGPPRPRPCAAMSTIAPQSVRPTNTANTRPTRAPSHPRTVAPSHPRTLAPCPLIPRSPRLIAAIALVALRRRRRILLHHLLVDGLDEH